MKLKIKRNRKGFTLLEVMVVVVIISIIAFLVAPELGLFNADSVMRECVINVNQNMRVARAMAIKENRQYLMVFDTTNRRYMVGADNDNDGDLTSFVDTFGSCNDTKIFDINADGDVLDAIDRGDGIPDLNPDANFDGVPDCVRVFNLNECGIKVRFGTLAPNGPDGTGDAICTNGLGVCFGNTINPIRVGFNADGSATAIGSVYLDHNDGSGGGKRYSYLVRISSNAGAMSIFRWDGDADYPTKINWTELR